MINRRDFLKSTGAAASMSAGPLIIESRASVPSDTVNVAVVGIRSRGGQHVSSFARLPNVKVVALCDVDERLFPEAVERLKRRGVENVKTEVDVRRILDDKNIDVISIATPDHWHAPATIWACQAGKDVYVEKPCSHNIWEGRKMVDAARKYNRVVQVGFQNRSNAVVQAAMKFLHQGGIGEIYMARGLCFKSRNTIGKKQDSTPPPGVHYDLWLGPAPKRPFNENRFHYNWHWFWEYGCADIGNQGPHQLDIARWGLNKDEYPAVIKSSGGHFAFNDDQQTPNTQIATMEYPDGKILQFEVRGLYTNNESDIRIGNLFYGTKGWMQLDSRGWKTFMGPKAEPGPSMSMRDEDSANPSNLSGGGDSNHFGNLIDAVRARNPKLLTSDIESGHRSTALAHLSNVSYRLKREVHFDSQREKFRDDKEANGLLVKSYRKPYSLSDSV
jgi:predicted dehydrogenase